MISMISRSMSLTRSARISKEFSDEMREDMESMVMSVVLMALFF